MSIEYIPVIKTSDSEMRALENLSEKAKNFITPLFELTRSRKSKNFPDGDLDKRLDKLYELYEKYNFILDLTGDVYFRNKQIKKLQNSANGYQKWVEFVVGLKDDFPGLIPTIQISDEGLDDTLSDEDYKNEYNSRLLNQSDVLSNNFELIAYRFPIEYEDYNLDLEQILTKISPENLICVINADFIHQGKSSANVSIIKSILNDLKKYNIKNIAIVATSFPRNPIEYGKQDHGVYSLEEYELYKSISDAEKELDIIYGDFASVNPKRSDQAGGNGWVPRIDLSTKNQILYYRSRKSDHEKTYAPAYIRVAEMMANDPNYESVKKKIGFSWGIEQIEAAALGVPPGLSPGYWISVRMVNHIELRRILLQK